MTFEGLIPILVDGRFFTDDLLLYDVPLVPTAVLSLMFFSIDTGLLIFFYTDELFFKAVEVLFMSLISFVFGWLIDDLLVFRLSF